MAIFTQESKLETNAGDLRRLLENMEPKMTALTNALTVKNVEANTPTQFINSRSPRMISVVQMFNSRWLTLLDTVLILSHTHKLL
jgi:hypothetical protein